METNFILPQFLKLNLGTSLKYATKSAGAMRLYT